MYAVIDLMYNSVFNYFLYRDNEVKSGKSNKEIWIQILKESVKETFWSVIMKKSIWNLISYILMFLIMSVNIKDPARDMIFLVRLEFYVIPVFWTITDEKVLLFLTIRLKKAFRIYQFS